MLKSIDVAGLELQTFGIFFALNFLCWAAVMARRVYLTDVDLFDQAWVKQGYDLRATIQRVIAIARDDKDRKPFAALRSSLGK